MAVWGAGASSPINRFTTPQLRFNGMDGALYRVERSPDASGELTDRRTDLPAGTALAMDFRSLHVGWLKFVGGVDTAKFMRPASEPVPPQPEDPDYR